MSKLDMFRTLAGLLNEQLQLTPLLYGSLGLEQRLRTDLKADDIDILIPKVWLHENWETFLAFMTSQGYSLYDLHEHAFQKDNICVAFASIESLWDFAGIDIAKIPEIRYNNSCYFLLDLEDYHKVYTASSFDGYRKDKKQKNDAGKLALIEAALNRSEKGV